MTTTKPGILRGGNQHQHTSMHIQHVRYVYKLIIGSSCIFNCFTVALALVVRYGTV